MRFLRKFCPTILILNCLALLTLAQYRNWRHIQNEMRIKLPSDISFSHETQSNAEGSTCFNLVRGVQGVCTLPNQCPEAVKDFKKGIQPQICNYKGHTPIICCPRPKYVPQTVSSWATPPSVPTTVTTRFTQSYPTEASTTTRISVPSVTPPSGLRARLSQQKCEEYMKLTVEENVVTTFALSEPENRPVSTSKCRKAISEGFIVGGTKTEIGEFAHMAVIGWQQDDDADIQWNCGGSLISYRYVLSAAHCVSWRGVKPKIIRLGDQNLYKSDEGSQPQDFSIAQAIRHPDYKTSSKYNDIALFKLDRNVRITDFVRPACLWQSFNLNYTSAIATGWGLTRDRGKSSDELLKVSLHLTSNERCSSLYERFTALKNGIVNSQLCAGDEYEERDTCNGDSGGPIQVATTNSACTYHIIGVTSFGKACGSGYGVYTRISEYIDWIESIAWNDSK